MHTMKGSNVYFRWTRIQQEAFEPLFFFTLRFLVAYMEFYLVNLGVLMSPWESMGQRHTHTIMAYQGLWKANG